MRPIVVLGAGSWGTALAIQFARGGESTVLWGRAEDEPENIARERENVRYLPGAKLPPALSIENASVLRQMANEIPAFHDTGTSTDKVSQTAPVGATLTALSRYD